MKRIHSLVVTAIALISLSGNGLCEERPDGRYAGQRAIYVEDFLNRQPAFTVRVDVDRKDRTYVVGDSVHVSVRSDRAGFLYLFYLQADGETAVLFPNRRQTDNRIEAKRTVPVPEENALFKLRVGLPTGKELLKAIVLPEPLEAEELKQVKFHDFTPVKAARVRAIFVEEVQGPLQNTEQSNAPSNPVDAKREKREWGEHHIEITTVDRKAKPTQTDARQRRVAVCIGISQFADDRIRDLTICHRDAESFAKMLSSSCGFDEVVLLTNEAATRQQIEQAIRVGLAEKTRPGDEVIIYWSGHGSRIADESGDEKTDGKDEVLIPHDARVGSIDQIKRTVITDDTFGRWIQELDGRRCLIILDTCHSGGQSSGEKGLFGSSATSGLANMTTNSDRFDFFDHELSRVKDIGQRGVAVLASSLASELSFERRQGDLSVMTSCMIRFVRKSNGNVPLKQLFQHLKKAVPEYVEEHEHGSTQTPFLVTDISPDFLVKR